MVPVAPKTAIQSAHSLLGQIGNTPLIRLAKVDEDLPGVEIYAKAEFFNPGGSVKDRAGLNMILEGERSGSLDQGPCSAGRHQRQHRHRVCDDLLHQGLPREIVSAG